jgi:hypothetical protein
MVQQMGTTATIGLNGYQLGILVRVQGLQCELGTSMDEVKMNKLVTSRNFVDDETLVLGHAKHGQLGSIETKVQALAFRETGPATDPAFIGARYID